MNNSVLYKILLLTLFFESFVGRVFAESVPIDSVKVVALNAYSVFSGNSLSEIETSSITPITKNDTIVMYVCSFIRGFVLVSADNVALPILGYSDEGFLDVEDMPFGVKFLTEAFAEEILMAKRVRAAASVEIQNEWRKYLDGNIDRSFYTPSIYLIQTKWGQSGGYLLPSLVNFNYYCPKHLNDYGVDSCTTRVGCGAVALAQILHYWACDVYPHGIVYNSNENIYLNLSDQNYEWYYMLSHNADVYNARLLADCAIAINSLFRCQDPGTTSYPSVITNRLRNNYGFADATLSYKTSDAVWFNLLKNSLDLRCPIFYAGDDTSGNGGHGWVVDGYTADNFFHCNFGWNGNYDGWYLLTNVTAGGYHLNNSHSAILNCYPTTYPNTEFVNVTIPNGQYTGHKVIIENSSLNANANVVIDSDCSTDIFGPFSVPIGSTLHVK